MNVYPMHATFSARVFLLYFIMRILLGEDHEASHYVSPFPFHFVSSVQVLIFSSPLFLTLPKWETMCHAPL